MSENPKIGQFQLNQAAAEMLLQSIKTVHGFLHSEEMSLSLSVDRVLGAAEGLLEMKKLESRAKILLLTAQAKESEARARNLDIDTELMGKEKTAQQMMVRVNTLFQKVERMERYLNGAPAPVPQAPAVTPTQPQPRPAKPQPRPAKPQRPPFNPQLAEALGVALKEFSAPEMVGMDGHVHHAEPNS